MSDFSAAVARVSEGHCPLCDERLAMFGKCTPCEVSWTLSIVPEGQTPALLPGRPLTAEETKRLYDRAGS